MGGAGRVTIHGTVDRERDEARGKHEDCTDSDPGPNRESSHRKVLPYRRGRYAKHLRDRTDMEDTR